MVKSELINELSAALSKAQAQMKGAKQDSANPFYKCKYADLSSVWDACRKPLTDNQLSVCQTLGIGDNGECIIETTLLHSSGQWITSSLQMPVETDPQKLGKEITYGRRYALAAIVGVSPEDDDAESISHPPEPVTSKVENIDYTEDKPTPYCPIHKSVMKEYTKGDRKWVAHKVGNNWCNGKEVKAPKQKTLVEEIKDMGGELE